MLLVQLSTEVFGENADVIFGTLNKNYFYSSSLPHTHSHLSTCLVQVVVVILLAINMAPTLSALPVTGSFIEFSMPLNSWIANKTSFSAY